MNRVTLFIIFFSFLYPRGDCLQFVEKDILGRVVRPEKQTSSLSPSLHFRIHYDITSEDGGTPPDLTDILPQNGVPDYIDAVGVIADSAYHVLVDIMGYDSEPSDGDEYDIYVISYSPGSYGHCVHGANGTSYLKIDNDYLGYASNFGQTPLEIMQITIVHEYFHAIQYGYQENHGSLSGSDAYFYEMTSMWIEDVILPDGNDYLETTWVGPLLNNPEGAFDDRYPSCNNVNCVGEGYELALFGHYLSREIDGHFDEKNSTIMRKIWEDYSNSYINSNNYDKPLEVIDRVLQSEYQISFIEAWVDFISRNLYNGINPDYYYYEDQALISSISTLSSQMSDSTRIDMMIDNSSVDIKSYSIANDDFQISINHLLNDYVGRVSIVSLTDNSKDDLLWAEDTTSTDYYSNIELHLLYGVNGPSNLLPIDLFVDICDFEYDCLGVCGGNSINDICGICNGDGFAEDFIPGLSVWPGNTNADNVVDVEDILPIGAFWGQTACGRKELASDMYRWEAQPLSKDECISHADANGDGVVDIADVLVVMVNWGKETIDSAIIDANCSSDSQGLTNYYDNFSQIYHTLSGDSDAEIQIRGKLESMFGFVPKPRAFQIQQNFPNPFNPSTVIPYYVPKQSRVQLLIFDVMGRVVIEKEEYIIEAGSHEVVVNGKDLSSGVYIYQFIIDGIKVAPKKMVLLR